MSCDVCAVTSTQVMVAKRKTKVLQPHHQKWVANHKPVDTIRISWGYPWGEIKTWGIILENEFAPPVSWIRAQLPHFQKFYEQKNSFRMSSLPSIFEQSIIHATGWEWLWRFNKCTVNRHVMRFWNLPFLLRVKTQRRGLYYLMLAHPHWELLAVDVAVPLIWFCNIPVRI